MAISELFTVGSALATVESITRGSTTTSSIYNLLSDDGADNPASVIRLGTIYFNKTAVPEQVKFGMKEQIVTHHIIGGAKIKDMMGDDAADISWSGFFLGPSAGTRANALLALVKSKQLQQLTYGTFSANVIVADLDLVYKKSYWIDYTIRCEVLPATTTPTSTNNAPAATPTTGTSGDSGIQNGNGTLSNSNTPSQAASGVSQGVDGNATSFGNDFTGDTFSYA